MPHSRIPDPGRAPKPVSKAKRFPAPLLGGAAALSVLVAGLLLFRGPGSQPNIILIVVDALRADHVGAYGYERDTTPVLDRLAGESVLFARAVSASNWTPVSVASMFTGVYAASHGMILSTSRDDSARLSDEFDTLAEILKRGGYQTAAVITNPWLTESFGLAQGFDDCIQLMGELRTADVVTKSASRTLAKLRTKKAPFFLYLHYLDPHKPYGPPLTYSRLFEEPLQRGRPSAAYERYLGLYDGEIRFADTMIGTFFEELHHHGLYKDAFIIVTADHGEQFGEHGHSGHAQLLYAEETHIPLIMKSGDRPHVVKDTVSNIDIFPTIIEAAHLKIPAGIPAVSLRAERELGKRRGVLTETSFRHHQRALVGNDGKKIILDFGPAPLPEGKELERATDEARIRGLFDLESDPLERVPLKDERLANDLRREMMTILRRTLGLRKDVQEGRIPAQTLEELRSLGYLK